MDRAQSDTEEEQSGLKLLSERGNHILVVHSSFPLYLFLQHHLPFLRRFILPLLRVKTLPFCLTECFQSANEHIYRFLTSTIAFLSSNAIRANSFNETINNNNNNNVISKLLIFRNIEKVSTLC